VDWYGQGEQVVRQRRVKIKVLSISQYDYPELQLVSISTTYVHALT
jgi:hypothetical protein